ncbi:MAG: hypothetical protein WCS97_03775 [Candidatus Paceibacterota bacterium]|jgi:glutathione synthase/RimK-type ligase-like ATP-grasp enzyme
MKNVLLIAGLGERYYYDRFIAPCIKEDLNIYLFDPSRLPKQAAITMDLNEFDSVVGYIDVLKHLGEELVETRLPIGEIDVAWYLRENYGDAEEDDSLATRFARNESRRAFLSLLSVLECKWVNRKEVIDRVSSNKFYQQYIAKQCGLTVPETLISNDPEKVAIFSSASGGLLLKTLGYMELDPAGNDFLYSERFSHEELVGSTNAIRACPIFAQRYVEKRYEYRVMMVGSKVLTCRIDSQSSSMTKTDWRHYDFEKVEHVRVELPVTIQKRLISFMEKIELNYGAIDLIETPSGDYVFLEVNPCGQWGWIEHYANLSIPQAVADMIKST